MKYQYILISRRPKKLKNIFKTSWGPKKNCSIYRRFLSNYCRHSSSTVLAAVKGSFSAIFVVKSAASQAWFNPRFQQWMDKGKQGHNEENCTEMCAAARPTVSVSRIFHIKLNKNDLEKLHRQFNLRKQMFN